MSNIRSGDQRVIGRLDQRWWIVAAVIPLLLAVLAALVSRSGIESSVEDAARNALTREGIAVTSVEASGRNVAVTVPRGINTDRVESLLNDIPEIGGVNATVAAAQAVAP